jgi:hypothetical protein
MSKVVKISYGIAGGEFAVRLDDEETEFFAVDLMNQLAVDGAFERRASVRFETDDLRIVRVMSEGDSASTPGKGSSFITRISSQRQVHLVAEIFYEVASSGRELVTRTRDPVLCLLCEGAYVSKHPLDLSTDGEGFVTEVVKRLATV